MDSAKAMATIEFNAKRLDALKERLNHSPSQEKYSLKRTSQSPQQLQGSSLSFANPVYSIGMNINSDLGHIERDLSIDRICRNQRLDQ